MTESDPHSSTTGGAAPIDRAHLAAQTAGDRDLQDELLGIFARQARDILARVSAEPREAELRERMGLFHTLSGSARAIGAWRVASDADALEDQARAGSLPRDLDALARSIAEACEAIETP